jgi:hypothetical protein
VIETGTHLGATTRYFASKGLPVLTIEMNPVYASIASERLRRDPHTTVFIGDSVKVLHQLARAGCLQRALFYLDAHSSERTPLLDELRIISSVARDTIIVIDDFAVPHDLGYGYDTYNGTPLAMSALNLPRSFTAGYPAISATAETGARRGTLYAGVGDGADCIEALIREHRLIAATSENADA